MGLFRKSGHAHLMLSAAVGALALGSGAAWAQSKPITVAPQTLASALHDFGSQTGRQIFFKPELAASKASPGVVGATDEQLALAQILQGTGLTFRREANAFIIEDASDPQSGSAAGAGADAGTVQALVVTAQKREENIQDVPIAMSAFTQEDLTRSQVAGGPDLMTQVPNFTFTKTNFSGYSIQIRGIGTQAISATVDPAVAVAFNNTPFIRNRFFEQEFYDLQRVEVLRGPQGTLYGRNATAGVANIISAKPSWNFDAKVSADVSNYNSSRLEGMINIPLVDDKVAFRLAGAWTKRDGYDTNELTGNTIDGRNLWSTRATLRFEPTDWLRANLIYEHFQEDDDRLRSGKQLCKRDVVTSFEGRIIDPISGQNGGGVTISALSLGCSPASLYSPDSFEAPNGYALPYYFPFAGSNAVPEAFPNPAQDPYSSTAQSRDLRVIQSTVDPRYKANNDVVELQAAFDLGRGLTLTSETGYNRDFIFSLEDYNRFNTRTGAFTDHVPPPQYPGDNDASVQNVLNNGYFCDPQIGCANRLVAEDLSTAKSRQFSQEFRLSSDFDGPFNFSLGTNFLRYDTEDKYYVFVNSLTLVAASGVIGVTPVRTSLMPPYDPGVSDNSQCLPKGLLPGNPTAPQSIFGCIYIDPNPIGSLNDMGHNYFLSRNPYKLISYAAFGEAYYDITPTLKLTAGLRWTVDKKEAPRIPSWLVVAGNVGYPTLEVVRQEWREPTGRLTLDWKPALSFTDQTLFYGSFAHGYKAGGANPPPAVVATTGSETAGLQESIAAPKTFDPEFVNAFEVGTKNTLLDGRLTLNGDVFYYDYTGYQVSQIVNRSAINYNFDAKIWGLEFEGDWRPLENLRLGLKVGYERTRIANGEQAIDIMDRTAGHTDWVTIRPFPTVPSNCVVPKRILLPGPGEVQIPYFINNGLGPGPCVYAYFDHLDPVTQLPYVRNPTVDAFGNLLGYQNYAGFDPATAPNNGEGFSKNLGSHELPNAPHFTVSSTVDYTVPLPNDWLLTLHSDLYYQSEAWARVFNTPGYDKLKAYTNVNVAAIFANQDAGWQVMAYVKNVFDKDNITGAFLNSDDSGLTTNVFLNEPRLYGLRVTKQWTGSSWRLPGGDRPAGQPWPLTVEIGGQVQRHDAPNSLLKPGFEGSFPSSFHPLAVQNRDMDWGDGREIKVTYRPGAEWLLTAAARFNEANKTDKYMHSEQIPSFCAWKGTPFESIGCSNPIAQISATLYANAESYARENHTIVDFEAGRETDFGRIRSTTSIGLRYAKLSSVTKFDMAGVPQWNFNPIAPYFKYESHDQFHGTEAADRSFEGAGPMLDWEVNRPMSGNGSSHLDLTGSINVGVAVGRQKTDIEGELIQEHFYELFRDFTPRALPTTTTTPVDIHRSKSVSVPVLDLSAGLSWEVDRFKVGAGYHWERYYNAIDGGYQEHKSYDRTIDGPYFKVSVGFGG